MERRTATGTGPRNVDWAEYLVYMEAGAELDEGKSPEPSFGKGLALAGTVAVAALAASQLPFLRFAARAIDPVMLAIPLGLLIGNAVRLDDATRSGVRAVLTRLLPLGIVLLGARLDLREIAALGGRGLALGLCVIAISLLVLGFVGRVLGLSRRTSTLLGVGTGICGGSAILAVAPAIEADPDEIAVSVTAVALTGVFFMLALPLLGHGLGLSPTDFGLWAGLATHQMPQAIAAGFALGPASGETATIAKLVRVCLLVPVAVSIGLLYRGRRSSNERWSTPLRSLVPGFIVGLLAVSLLRTLGLLPTFSMELGASSIFGARALSVDAGETMMVISRGCILVAMSAVGIETRFEVLRTSGLKQLGATFVGSMVVCALALWLVRLSG